jgi:LacI family transcriptional regulator
LAEHNIPYDRDLVINDEMGNDEQSAKEIFGKYYDEATEKPDGVFASTDMIALGAIQALKARGLRVPEDVCVVGFSNWQFTSLTEPTITTVAQPGFEMGQEAARLLIREIEADDDTVLEPVLKTLKTTLIIRDSSNRKKK